MTIDGTDREPNDTALDPATHPAGETGYVLYPGQGVLGAGSDVKASRRSTGGSLSVIESRTTGGAPRHTHAREDEAFYVIAGALTVGCGTERFEAGPGSFVFLPRGVPHEWDVVGDEATLLMITAPAGLDELLRDLHAPGAGDRNEIAARHGVTWG